MSIVHVKYGVIECDYLPSSVIQRKSIIVGSYYESNWLSSVLQEFIKVGDTVFDIGACYGLWTLPLSVRVGDYGKVIAIEPEKSVRMDLLRNLELNNASNVEVLDNLILDSDDDLVSFYSRSGREVSSVFEEVESAIDISQLKTMVMRTISLDTLVLRGLVPQPQFIKLDVEGAELKVITGGKNVLKNAQSILIELHPKVLSGLGVENITAVLVDMLETIGYESTEWYDDTHLLFYK